MSSSVHGYRSASDYRHVGGARSAHLLSLVRRMAVGDSAAFAELYDTMSAQLLIEVQSSGVHRDYATAIVSSTYVETWQMARFHTRPEDDVKTWLSAIVSRRSIERRLVEMSPMYRVEDNTPGTRTWWVAATENHDRLATFTLAALLNRPVREVEGHTRQRVVSMRRRAHDRRRRNLF